MCHEVRTPGTVLLCQNSTSIVTLTDRVTVTLHTAALPLPAVKKHIDNIQITALDIFLLTPPMKMEQTECSETSAYKIQMLGNHPKTEYYK